MPNCESNPRRKSMKKNSTDQRGPTDISPIASVMAMNAKPGPDLSSSKETSETVYV